MKSFLKKIKFLGLIALIVSIFGDPRATYAITSWWAREAVSWSSCRVVVGCHLGQCRHSRNLCILANFQLLLFKKKIHQIIESVSKWNINIIFSSLKNNLFTLRQEKTCRSSQVMTLTMMDLVLLGYDFVRNAIICCILKKTKKIKSSCTR